MYLKLDESKWYRHTQEWSDRSKGLGRVDVYKGQIEVVEDVAPVVSAYWRCDFKTSEWNCTRCGGIALRLQGYSATALSEYCPHCGAKMLFDEGFDQNEDDAVE